MATISESEILEIFQQVLDHIEAGRYNYAEAMLRKFILKHKKRGY